jgi:Ser/Thr protein kinase RdoA (MazF antagonist)
MQELTRRLYQRSGLERLPAHLESAYGVRVAAIEPLDGGVMRVDLAHGRRWVARVFPAGRPRRAVEGDAEVLRYLEAEGYPAERLAHTEPVSDLEGQCVLVTEFVEGGRASPDEAMLWKLGELLGRLHALPGGGGAIAREAGSLHHWSPEGGSVRRDIDAALSWLDEASEDPGDLEALREAVASLDDGAGLPLALIHPDFQHENAIDAPGHGTVMIDWAGAGRGPRIVSLAILLVLAVNRNPNRLGLRAVQAAVEGYSQQIKLEPEEWERVPDALVKPGLLLDCFMVALGRKSPSDALEGLRAMREAAKAMSARVKDIYLSGS